MSPTFAPTYQFFLTNLAVNASALGYTIDNQGRVAGVLSTADESGTRVGGFMWYGGDLKTFGPLAPGADLHVRAMNDYGAVVGDSNGRAFVWRNDTLTDLNQLLPQNSGWQLLTATAINEHGQIAGVGVRNGQSAGFLMENASITDLGLSGTNISISALNNSSQIVGQANGRPFIREKGQAADLNDLIPSDASWELETAVDINDLGCIVGAGLVPTHSDCCYFYSNHAVYELIPVGGPLGITGSRFTPSDTFELQYLQTDATPIVLQVTTDFVQWTDLATNRPPIGLATISDPNPPTSRSHFYRLLRLE